MNIIQRRILKISAAIIILMLIFPPFALYAGPGKKFNQGYSVIFDPPLVGDFETSVETPLLLTQIAGVSVACCMLVFAFKE